VRPGQYSPSRFPAVGPQAPSTARAGVTHARPATPAKWKYRAIYRVGDARVGLWSAEASIAVGA